MFSFICDAQCPTLPVMSDHWQASLTVERLHAVGEDGVLRGPGLGAQVLPLDVPPGVVVDVLDGQSGGEVLVQRQDGLLVVHAREGVVVVEGPVVAPEPEVVGHEVLRPLLHLPHPGELEDLPPPGEGLLQCPPVNQHRPQALPLGDVLHAGHETPLETVGVLAVVETGDQVVVEGGEDQHLGHLCVEQHQGTTVLSVSM